MIFAGQTYDDEGEVLYKMKKTRAALAVAAGLAMLPLTGTAYADPSGSDPHMPNLSIGYCPGGRGGILAVAWCNGEKYPDGSYWHNVAMTGGTFATPRFEMNCVIDDAFPSGTPAPPGGCGGAV